MNPNPALLKKQPVFKNRLFVASICTQGALAQLPAARAALDRFHCGDWGEESPMKARNNELIKEMKHGSVVVAKYGNLIITATLVKEEDGLYLGKAQIATVEEIRLSYVHEEKPDFDLPYAIAV